MLVGAKMLSAFAYRILIVGPRTRVGAMRRHHVLLVRALINVDGSLLHSALLKSLCLLLQFLSVLLVGLDQLDFFLGSFIVRYVLLIL